MIKLLNTKTGIIFTLPDDEALKIKKQDRVEEFKILDAGYVEEKEPEKVSGEDISNLVLKTEERKEEIEEEDLREEKKEAELNPETKEYETEMNLEKYGKLDLIGMIRRVGGNANKNWSKPDLIKECLKLGIKP